MHMCMYTYVHMRIYIYIYIHVYTHIQSHLTQYMYFRSLSKATVIVCCPNSIQMVQIFA